MLPQSGEQCPPVGGAKRRFDVVLGMGHHADHVAAFVHDPRNGMVEPFTFHAGDNDPSGAA